MLNTYGYNRKTLEEDERILANVRRHHDYVAAQGYLVVMTSLVGSQNYDLDDENSDIDTYSLILPPLSKIVLGEDLESGLLELEDGHCNYKDIRLALRLLRKASPNSVEYFVSKYKIYNPIFEDILREYLDDNSKIWNMIHCNYNHMLYSIAGMGHQLTKRNMPAGKQYAHALRLRNMYYNFMNSPNAGAVLDLRPQGDRDLALIAKRDSEPDHIPAYTDGCLQIAESLDTYKEQFTLTEEQKLTQQKGLALIDSFQWKVFKKYLEEVNK